MSARKPRHALPNLPPVELSPHVTGERHAIQLSPVHCRNAVCGAWYAFAEPPGKSRGAVVCPHCAGRSAVAKAGVRRRRNRERMRRTRAVHRAAVAALPQVKSK